MINRPFMNLVQAKYLFSVLLFLLASGCNSKEEAPSHAAMAKSPTSRAKVICSYAPSQSDVVSHLAAMAGSSAITAASVAQAAGLTAVLHSSGAYIFTSAGGYVAGTIGAAAALPAIVTVGVAVGGTAVTLELICASTTHPELASRVKAAASDFMTRSNRMVAVTSKHAVAGAKPFIAESKSVVARARTDAFEYASRASVRLSEKIRATVN
jgi:hypothetical protein